MPDRTNQPATLSVPGCDEELERPTTCSIAGCGRPLERVVDGVGPLCAAHRKRLQRIRRGTTTLTLAAPVIGDFSPLELVIVAGHLMLEADSEDDRAWDRALARFLRSCEEWLLSRGWRPAPGAGAAGHAPAAPAPLEAAAGVELER